MTEPGPVVVDADADRVGTVVQGVAIAALGEQVETAHLGLGAQGDFAGQSLHRAVAVLVLGGDALFRITADLAVDPADADSRRNRQTAGVGGSTSSSRWCWAWHRSTTRSWVWER